MFEFIFVRIMFDFNTEVFPDACNFINSFMTEGAII